MGFWKNLAETILAPTAPASVNAAAALAVAPTAHGYEDAHSQELPEMACPKATRVTVVGRDGRVFEDYDLFDNGCTVIVQDDGRTVKVLRR